MATISIGVVLVLLLGEIDLSVGAVSGLAASVMAVLSVKEGLVPVLAIVAGLAVGAAIGLFNGFFVTTFGIPSFVVTLAGLIGWQGVQLARPRRHRDDQPAGRTSSPTSPGPSSTRASAGRSRSAVIAAYAASVLWRPGPASARRARGWAALRCRLVKIALVAAAIIAAVAILNEDRGVPLAAVIVVGLTAIFSFITERTRCGRHICTPSAATPRPRAGPASASTRVRISVFTLASTLAAAGGILPPRGCSP